MANVLIMEQILEDLADIIRDRNNVSITWIPSQLPAQISGMSGVIPVGNINLTNAATTYNVTNYLTAQIVDSNLVSANIKGGVTILGVAGKTSVKETNDANAVAADITLNKTGYVNGAKITGSAKPTVSGTTVIFPVD